MARLGPCTLQEGCAGILGRCVSSSGWRAASHTAPRGRPKPAAHSCQVQLRAAEIRIGGTKGRSGDVKAEVCGCRRNGHAATSHDAGRAVESAPAPADFLAFGVPTMNGEVRRYFRDHGWSVKVPRSMNELGFQLNRAARSCLNGWDVRHGHRDRQPFGNRPGRGSAGPDRRTARDLPDARLAPPRSISRRIAEQAQTPIPV